MVKKILVASAFVTSFSAFTAPDCQETGTVCIAPNQTRNVSGLSIFRECWEYQDTYRCHSQNMVNDCQPLRDGGRSQIGSLRVEHDGSGTCVVCEQKYSYPDKPETYTEKTVCNQSAFCQSGGAGCFDTSAPPNKDSDQTTVIMETTYEAGAYGVDPNKVEIFKGYMKECSIKVLGDTTLKSCCKSTGGGAAFNDYALLGTGMKAVGEANRKFIVLGSRYICDSLHGQLNSSLVDEGLGAMNNWAPGLGDGVLNLQFGFYGFTSELTFTNGFQFVGSDLYNFALSVAIMLVQERLNCDSAEQVMAVERGQDLCAHIETYCSKKVLKVCVEKKERRCCLSSKLVKIVSR